MKWLITHMMLILFALHAVGQERSLRIATDREEILIGEQLVMTLTLTAQSGDTVLFPEIGDTLIKEIEVIERDTIDTTFDGSQLEKRVLTQELILTSFDSGYFVVEPLQAIVNGEILESNPLLLTVQTIKIDTAQGIMDIKPIEEVPFAWKEWFQENWHWFVIGLIALIAITVIALYFSKERPTETEEIIPEVIRPAHEIAFERLDELLTKELWQKGEIKAYYSELTEVLREYIEHRFTIPALEQTSDEIVSSMQRTPDFTIEQVDRIKRLLFLSDLVKFAKEKPIGSENEQYATVVRTFIEETKLEVDFNESTPSEDA